MVTAALLLVPLAWGTTPLTPEQRGDVERLASEFEAVVRISIHPVQLLVHGSIRHVGVVEESFQGPLKVGDRFVFCKVYGVGPDTEVAFLNAGPGDVLGLPRYCSQPYLHFRKSLDGKMVADRNTECVSRIGMPSSGPNLYSARHGVGEPLIFETAEDLPGFAERSAEDQARMREAWGRGALVVGGGPHAGSQGMEWEAFLTVLRGLSEDR